ncbi:uncharacterized protein LOC113225855 [Hyposmocoma kahamanoa]|uniref:uncharacterized protein LOC113225855 n=1 Tax=Hyposmocoma kahamanoa TaxID=1477025 RepID=UPI000E6D628F|nr:uncharacterized protein LOC113225855 [Hyposmocoma kahamanoa]
MNNIFMDISVFGFASLFLSLQLLINFVSSQTGQDANETVTTNTTPEVNKRIIVEQGVLEGTIFGTNLYDIVKETFDVKPDSNGNGATTAMVDDITADVSVGGNEGETTSEGTTTTENT